MSYRRRAVDFTVQFLHKTKSTHVNSNAMIPQRMFDGHLTPRQIRLLPLNDKEVKHCSRTQKGLHVFLSRYITSFFNATIERQQELVELHNVRTYNNDAISIDSTDTAFQEYDKVTMGEVMKIAFRQWRYMLIKHRVCVLIA